MSSANVHSGFCWRALRTAAPRLESGSPRLTRYDTPLGRTVVDRELAGSLTAEEPFRKTAESKVCDHSIEIQLPLLQKAAPEAKVVPLYVSHLEPEERQAAALRLADCLTPGTVLIASSDLTHFGSAFRYQPFAVDSRVAEKLRKLDYGVLEAAGSLREELFLDTLRETGATVCGADPIALLLATVRNLDRAGEIFEEVLDYQTSGEITEDFHHSVSYGAAGFFPQIAFELNPAGAAGRPGTGQAHAGRLPEDRQGHRSEFAAHGSGGAGPAGGAVRYAAQERRVARLHGPQRGLRIDRERGAGNDHGGGSRGLALRSGLAVGNGHRGRSLDPVADEAYRRPRRFPGERARRSAEGRRQQGLLLPQVATERGWSADRFFRALAEKTGVGAGVYSDPSTRIYVFRAQIIH